MHVTVSGQGGFFMLTAGCICIARPPAPARRNRRWRRALGLTAAAAFCWAAVGATVPARGAEAGTTNFGRSLFAVLDDSDSRIRGYGWRALEVLGSASEPNELHTQTFKHFLARDGEALARRIEALLSQLGRTTSERGDHRETKDETAEFEALRQSALGVPEIAAILVRSPSFAAAVSAKDLEQIKLASVRIRPDARQFQLASLPDNEVGRLISVLRSS